MTGNTTNERGEVRICAFRDRGPNPQLQPQFSPWRKLRLSVRALAFRRAPKSAYPHFARHSREGFTLIEMLVTIAIFGLVMVITANLLLAIFSNATTNPNALNAVDQAQGVTSTFVNQVRDAAYGNDGSYPLNQASTTQIIFFSPFGSSGSTTVDRIRYFVASSTLYEGITIPSGSPATYNTANEQITTVLPHVSGSGTSTIFYYYNGTYAGTSSPLSQPVSVNQVTYVGITLAVQLQEVIGATTTSVISTGAAIRNLKTNLGN
jgi:prepilin-type N-terminal cleavage/methylation domain-containing protein